MHGIQLRITALSWRGELIYGIFPWKSCSCRYLQVCVPSSVCSVGLSCLVVKIFGIVLEDTCKTSGCGTCGHLTSVVGNPVLFTGVSSLTDCGTSSLLPVIKSIYLEDVLWMNGCGQYRTQTFPCSFRLSTTTDGYTKKKNKKPKTKLLKGEIYVCLVYDSIVRKCAVQFSG